MKKMTIIEASEYFGVSKEAIHNRVRRGSLKSDVEDGVKIVFIDEQKPQVRKTRQVKAPSTDDRYYKLLEEQNAKLQAKVEKLEDETKTLREQKEQMLIAEKINIEQIYKEKDEQLKNFLNAISSKFIPQVEEPLKIEEHVEAEIEETKPKLISLKKYLKKNNISTKKIDKIFKKFKKLSKKDERVVKVGAKYYIDIEKYNYDDIFKIGK